MEDFEHDPKCDCKTWKHNVEIEKNDGLHEVVGKECDGELFWDIGAEGHFCTKCDYYDGPK